MQIYFEILLLTFKINLLSKNIKKADNYKTGEIK